jgi:molybdenum cofactor cytidylyltransferase
MRFGPVPLAEAEGAIAAHSVRLSSGVIRKGTRLTADLVARLAAGGIGEIIAARLD